MVPLNQIMMALILASMFVALPLLAFELPLTVMLLATGSRISTQAQSHGDDRLLREHPGDLH